MKAGASCLWKSCPSNNGGVLDNRPLPRIHQTAIEAIEQGLKDSLIEDDSARAKEILSHMRNFAAQRFTLIMSDVDDATGAKLRKLFQEIFKAA